MVRLFDVKTSLKKLFILLMDANESIKTKTKTRLGNSLAQAEYIFLNVYISINYEVCTIKSVIDNQHEIFDPKHLEL